jgi:hypothetical protein
VLNRALISRPPNGRFQGLQCTLLKSGCAILHFYVAHPAAAGVLNRIAGSACHHPAQAIQN